MKALTSNVPGVTDQGQVTVRTITLTIGSSLSGAPSSPIVINGAFGTGEDSATHPLRQEALVIDARNLPPGTEVRLDNVEFAIVIGGTRMIGGDGRNFVVGDDAAQFVVLGAGDDVLRGGGGDDTVGSKGGNDTLYGDGGNDWVVGGIGNDTVIGGDGNDLLQGGVSDAGHWTFKLDRHGQLNVGFLPTEAELADSAGMSFTGVWTSATGEGPITDTRFAWVYDDYAVAKDVALLAQALVGRLPTLGELGGLADGSYTSAQLGQMAHDLWVQTGGAMIQSRESQVGAVIQKVLGRAAVTSELVNLGVGHLNAGGSWSDIWLALARSGTNANRITDAQGNTSLIDQALGETGWHAGSGDDHLLGGVGNDVLVGGAGNDVIDGGAGIDMAVFFGTIADYQVALHRNAVTGAHDALIRHKVIGDVDTVRDVELFKIGGSVYLVPAGQPQPADDVYVEMAEYVQASVNDLVLVGLPPSTLLG